VKPRLDPKLKLCRAIRPYVKNVNDHNSAYLVSGPLSRKLYVIVSDGGGWDHVSVSLPETANETPTWTEMCYIKDLFFDPEEVVVQYHPPHSRYINIDGGCLHLWRPQQQAIPMPPLEYV